MVRFLLEENLAGCDFPANNAVRGRPFEILE